jgi:hypothetical protein
MSQQTPTELGAAERQLSDFPGNVVTVAAIVAVIVRGSNPQWGVRRGNERVTFRLSVTACRTFTKLALFPSEFQTAAPHSLQYYLSNPTIPSAAEHAKHPIPHFLGSL